VFAIPEQRPNFVAADLRSLLSDSAGLRIGPHPAWQVTAGRNGVTVQSTGHPADDALAVVRATAAAMWSTGWSGQPPLLTAGDETARVALERWSLIVAPIG
jgi:glycerol-1-phosphatase